MRGFVVVDVAIHAVPLVRTLDVAVQQPGLVAAPAFMLLAAAAAMLPEVVTAVPSVWEEAVVTLLWKRVLLLVGLLLQMVLMECRMHHRLVTELHHQ